MHKLTCLLGLIFLIQINLVTAQTFKTASEAKGLPVGAKVPMFSTKDQFGKTFKLAEALRKGPVVVLFYRGQWCPVCNRHLSRVQDSLQQVYAKGATVIAISPESSEYAKQTAKKTNASFRLLHDKNYLIGNAFDVIFKPDDAQINIYNGKLNAQLEKAHSDKSNRLPIPATFIINKKGRIVWSHFNSDYRIRASIKDILNHLPKN